MVVIVGGIIEKENKYLLVQEAKKKCYKKWNIPAGHLEQNETIYEGVKREIKEETGCDVEITGICHVSEKIERDETIIFIICSTKLINEEFNYNENEILDVKWFTYDEIMNMKDELRTPEQIISIINDFENSKILNLPILTLTNR